MNETIVHNVLSFCEKRGMSQKQMCRRADIPYTTFWRWKTNRATPDLRVLGVIADTLGVRLASLLRGL